MGDPSAETVAREGQSSLRPDVPQQIPAVPSVWRESHLLLVLGIVREREVYYFHLNLGARTESIVRFVERVKRKHLTPMPTNPVHLALNVIARKRGGTLDTLRVKEERKIAMMLDKQELLTMNDRELANCYCKLKGLHKELSKLPGDKSDCIDEMIALAQQVAEKDIEVAAKKAAKSTERKNIAEAKGEGAARREPKQRLAEVNPAHPFRAGTMKGSGWDFFIDFIDNKKGDEKQRKRAMVTFLLDAGAQPASAASWYTTFSKAYAKLKEFRAKLKEEEDAKQ